MAEGTVYVPYRYTQRQTSSKRTLATALPNKFDNNIPTCSLEKPSGDIDASKNVVRCVLRFQGEGDATIFYYTKAHIA